MYDKPRLLPVSDSALLVEFGDEISEALNSRVHALARALEHPPLRGVEEVVPAYRSLLIHYSPLDLSLETLTAFVSGLLEQTDRIPQHEARIVEIPVAYGDEYGPDLSFVADHNRLSPAKVIQLHAGTTYSVYMLGFILGFAYLGGLPQALVTPRLATPRTLVPAGSVGIAETQTGIYSVAAPGGWRIIGRTPYRLFDVSRDPPTLLRPGDRVRFVPIPAEQFETHELEGEWPSKSYKGGC